MSNRVAIEEQAATWLQKRDGEDWGADDQAHLSQWLDAETHHRVAFLRLEAAWSEMNRLQAIGAGYPRGRVPSAEELETASPELPFRTSALAVAPLRDRAHDAPEGGAARPDASPLGQSTRPGALRSLRVALAACLVIALVIGGGASYFWTHFSRIESYSTALGGLASVPIKDGSKITLSSGTAVRVRLGYTERRIELAQGEAFFEVAKDPDRPFIVAAGADRVIAVGTKFSVRRDENADLRVVVTEGTVRLEHGTTVRLLPAGSIAHVSSSPVSDPRSSSSSSAGSGNTVIVQAASIQDAESLLSWRSGYVVFHETPLADAVAEFNRYNPRKLVIDDPQIANIRLTGKFRSTNIDSFSRLLQQSFPVQAKDGPEGIVLSASESKAPTP